MVMVKTIVVLKYFIEIQKTSGVRAYPWNATLLHYQELKLPARELGCCIHPKSAAASVRGAGSSQSLSSPDQHGTGAWRLQGGSRGTASSGAVRWIPGTVLKFCLI